jgi:hypothetical protein
VTDINEIESYLRNLAERVKGQSTQ